MGETIEQTAISILPKHAVSTILAADEKGVLEALQQELDGFVTDATTVEGRKQARSKAHKVSEAKQELIRIAETLKEDAQKTVKAVNAEIRIVRDKMDELRDRIKGPVEEFEAREEKRVAAHKQALEAIREHAEYYYAGNVSVSALEKRLALLRNPPERDWEEFAPRAAQIFEEEIARTETLLKLERLREREAEELAKLRAEAAERQRQEAEKKREEEGRLRAEQRRLETEKASDEARRAAERDAAEKMEAARREMAKREAEAARQAQEANDRAALAEAARVMAEARAAEEKRFAEARADAARQAAIEQERRRVAAEQEAERRAAEKRAVDIDNRRLKNTEALREFVKLGLSEGLARVAIIAIAEGKIPHISISY